MSLPVDERLDAPRDPLLGVLGGMGPLATAAFLRLLALEADVAREQEHLPLVVVSDPRVPERVAPIVEGRGASPLPALLEGLARLEQAGASFFAMPCNTAHAWYGELAGAAPGPFLHIGEALADELAARGQEGRACSLLATRATLVAGLFGEPARRARVSLVEPDGTLLDEALLPAIRAVKEGRLDEARSLLAHSLARLEAQGATAHVVACTELSVLVEENPRSASGAPLVDALAALARACLRHAGVPTRR